MYTFAVISHSCFYELFYSVVYLIEPRACQRSHIGQIPLQSDRRGKLCQGSQSTLCCVSAFHQTSLLPEQYIDFRLQRIWLFFRKWRTHTLWWVQYWNLRHIFDFWAFFVVCLHSFKKCKQEHKIFFKTKKLSKYTEFPADFKFVENYLENPK